MGSYLVRRFLLMALTLFGMSVLIFIMLRLVPGDIADILVDAAGIVDAKEKARIAAELGIDRPILEQYGQWIGGLMRGDLGFAGIPASGDVMTFLFGGPRLHPFVGVGNVLFAAAVILVVSVISTFYPAFVAARIQPIVAMSPKE